MPLRSTGFDYHPENNDDVKNNPDDKLDLTLDYYSHQKFLIIQGNYAGNPNAQLVFTGSSNWGALGSVNDEILVAVQGKKVARQYLKQFNFEWRPGNSRNAYTTSYLHFRVPVVHMGAGRREGRDLQDRHPQARHGRPEPGLPAGRRLRAVLGRRLSQTAFHEPSLSGLRTAQMRVIRSSATSNANTVTVAPSCRPRGRAAR